MTKPTNDFLQPQPQSGQGLHTQESGDDGLSSNMKHTFIDHNNGSAPLPVADKGSCVKPIPKEERSTVVPWSHTSVSEYATGPKTHTVFAEEEFKKPPTLIVAKKINFPPQAVTDNIPEEEAVKIVSGKTAITEEHAEVEGDESCTKMDSGEIPETPKGPTLVGREGRSKGRTASKHWKVFFPVFQCSSVFPLLLLVIPFMAVGVSEGSSDRDCKCRDIQPTAGKCYTCKDKDGCSKLKKIYDSRVYLNPKEIYQGDNTKFPRCSEISPPGDNCTVCLDLSSSINIFCSEHIEEIFLVEGNGINIGTVSLKCVKLQPPGPTSHSVSLSNVSPNPNVHYSTRRGLISSFVEKQQPPGQTTHHNVSEPNVSQNPIVKGRTHLGLICSFVLFLIVLAALGISYHDFNRSTVKKSEEGGSVWTRGLSAATHDYFIIHLAVDCFLNNVNC
ncbi:uncharacterized protein LOC117500494 isoform X3 [Trematomus bernacchii]|uniref:uncharacterized protein LOC117500494 isoform X3 n=1 Tax=Trematomus bernacchii TaxID=40690 RepID=UPI00146C5B1E|nr:uncharacterized protein LOC117500494 isoform X3 [Trematomus bernacchii]